MKNPAEAEFDEEKQQKKITIHLKKNDINTQEKEMKIVGAQPGIA